MELGHELGSPFGLFEGPRGGVPSMAQGKKSTQRRRQSRSAVRAARRRARARRRAGELRRRLKRFLPDDLVQRVATETGWIQRVKKIAPQAFVWTLVLGFAGHTERTIATLRREFERATGIVVVP